MMYYYFNLHFQFIHLVKIFTIYLFERINFSSYINYENKTFCDENKNLESEIMIVIIRYKL